MIARLFKSEARSSNVASDWDRIAERIAASLNASSGVTITTETAETISAVYACVRVLSEDAAKLPLAVFEPLDGGGRVKATDSPAHQVLRRPNDAMTGFDLRETMTAHVALRGNGYAYVLRNNANRPVGLYPLHPGYVTPGWRSGSEFIPYGDTSGRSVAGLERAYLYAPPGGEPRRLRQAEVLHLRGPGDGYVGKSVVTLAREALGLAAASERYGARYFGNGARPDLLLKHPKTLSPQARKNLKESWREAHEGVDKAHAIALLEEGLDAVAVGHSNQDAQFLQLRQHQVEDIARWFRMPPHKIGHLLRATYSNIEHQSLEYVTDTLLPWLVRWESRIDVDLLSAEEIRAGRYSKHVVKGLLRGDVAARTAFYSAMLDRGVYCADQVLDLEDENPQPGGLGKTYFVPMNMMAKEQALENHAPSLPGATRASSPCGCGAVHVVPASRKGGKETQRAQVAAFVARTRTLRRRYGRLIGEAAARAVTREVAQIRQAAKRHLNRSRDSFEGWLRTFYQDTYPGTFRTMFAPTFTAYAEAVREAMESYIGTTAGEDLDLDAFVRDYTAGRSQRIAGSGLGQLLQVIRDAAAAGEDLLEAIEGRLEEWEQTRADKFRAREEVQSGSAFQEFLGIGLGVAVFQWASAGETCPYCQDLDGTTVSAGSPFLVQGERYQPEGAEVPLDPSSDVRHPPAHAGCDCVLVPLI